MMEGVMDGPGVSASSNLAVTAVGGNMQVSIAAGGCFIDGASSATQGYYHCYNDAAVTKTFTAAAAGLHRNDLVYVCLEDAAYTGSTNAWSLKVVSGATVAYPGGTPVDPVAPEASVYYLARVRIIQSQTVIVSGDITDLRAVASASPMSVGPLAAKAGHVASTGHLAYFTESGRTKARLNVHNGTDWMPLTADTDITCKKSWTGSVTATTPVALTFATVDYDPYSISTSGSTITINQAGRWRFTASAKVASSGTAIQAVVYVAKAGVQVGEAGYAMHSGNAIFFATAQITDVVNLAVSDAITMYYGAVGGTGTFSSAALVLEYLGP